MIYDEIEKLIEQYRNKLLPKEEVIKRLEKLFPQTPVYNIRYLVINNNKPKK